MSDLAIQDLKILRSRLPLGDAAVLSEQGRRLNDFQTDFTVTSETPILPRVAQGEPAAVAECLNRYRNLVWSLARRSCPDIESAEDAVQDIFLKLWAIADRFDANIASETTFVAMIARRRLIDLSRKKSWGPAASAELDQFSSDTLAPAERAELNDEAAKAAALLDELPEDQKKVIRLSIYDGLSHSRIAETTGLSLGTVKTNIRRGMIKLRNALFPDEETLIPDSPLLEGESS